MSQAKKKPVKGAKNKNQYVAGFSDSYDFILIQLKDFFFNKGFTKKSGKWTFTKFCILCQLYDYADEIVKDFKYTPEQLLELINHHQERTEKFEKILTIMASEKQAKQDKILSKVNIDLGDIENGEE